MRHYHIFFLVGIVIPLILLLSLSASGQHAILQSVYGSGGGSLSSADNKLIGTVGQPLIGINTGTSDREYIGFWNTINYHVTGVNDEPNLSSEFHIGQNYPNPFNTKTTISYALPGDSHVILSVFNALGEKVASLVDKTQQAGQYTVVWDASSFVSGTYFCHLEAGNNIETSVLLLIK